MLFGRDARGVLQLIKQNWLKDDVAQNLKSTNVIDFVLNLREKIKISLATANEIESNAKKKSKIYYDRKSQQDSFNVGNQVLLLLPLRGKPLQARYSGPYTIEARIGEVDYVVLTHDRRKTKRIVHRNLMKRFHVHNTALVALVAIPVSVDPDDQLDKVDVKHLQRDQRLQLISLLQKYQPIFDPDPGFTTVVQHKISLIPNAKPCRQTSYCLSPDKTGGAKTRWFGSALR